ncbi:hypothetical protein BJ138DRAFT_1054509 [Hygrophoropsis aurantiaca]|uniref:Uncharacterized protein n=1 Tax=Hygrophoropsis aurantiaca TaxID=72124 RepID=A0ACB8AQW8_9AGAM|nr:hypothetical protein BJ138DRAFT_1054509 [Hygrophoropsis aurantiaca]
MAAAFFYGTLMHPEILKRVIGNDGLHLKICPALLSDYTRHQVKHADYPGIIPYSKSRSAFNHDLDLEERSVRGSLVTGLSAEDIRLLDIFEGNEYTREEISVHPLAPLVAIHEMPPVDMVSLVPVSPPPVPSASELSEAVKANTYVWCRPVSELMPELWTFEEFVKYNAWKWVGNGASSNEDYDAVDSRRQMEGIIVRGEMTTEVVG